LNAAVSTNETKFIPGIFEPGKRNFPTFSGFRAYLLVVCAVAGAFTLRLALDSLWSDRLAYAWFFLAVLVVARFAGTGPQITAVAGGMLLGNWFFIAPRGSLEISGTVDQINTGIFLGVSALVVIGSGRARRMVGTQLAARDRIVGIFECTSDAVCTVNNNWQVTYFNARACGLLKLQVTQVLGRDYWQLFPELQGTRFEREYRRVLQEKVTVHFEEFDPQREQWMEVHACPYGNGVAIFFRDVSNRKRAEASRAQLAAIVESSNDAIIGQSKDGLIVSWNAAAERLYGYCADEAIGRSLDFLFPSERRSELVPMLERVCCGERVNHFEMAQRTKSGGLLDVSLTISPVQTKDSVLVGISITARDVSERKRQEQERERLIRELKRAMAEVKTLSGMLPICSHCKKIRDDRGYWNQIESYICARSNAKFTHGMCPDCVGHLYPDLQVDIPRFTEPRSGDANR
jgi:PAS domain S-box-containing protein